MSKIIITLDQLRGLIGILVGYQGSAYRIIEVLEDGPAIVLEPTEERMIIQSSQHGHATRKVPEILTLPVLGGSGEEISAEFLSLDLIEPFE